MKKLPPWPVIRSTILFFFALGGITWETVVEKTERPTLLILFGMMAGLPIFINAEDRLHRPEKDPREEKRKPDDEDS